MVMVLKDTIQKMTGSIHYERYKNLPLNCEYEFELFMELKGQFTKVTLINAYLVKMIIYQMLNILNFV